LRFGFNCGCALAEAVPPYCCARVCVQKQEAEKNPCFSILHFFNVAVFAGRNIARPFRYARDIFSPGGAAARGPNAISGDGAVGKAKKNLDL
jgi:hypothetical protein